ncbi:MAG TPA: hypothetical protein VFY43_03280 [Candidatus Limnocylindria bacterium]|nr:hypothetical protein [Candidatus Limnocylindria bacterium]
MADPASIPTQPCASCGRSTAAGSPRFAGRRVIPPSADDTAAESSYLCEECLEQVHAATRDARLTDEQLRAKIQSGEIAGWSYEGVGAMAGFMPGAGGLGPAS